MTEKRLKSAQSSTKLWIYGVVSTMDSAINQKVVQGTKGDIRQMIFEQIRHAQQTDSEGLIQGLDRIEDVLAVGNMLTAKAEFDGYVVVITATEVNSIVRELPSLDLGSNDEYEEEEVEPEC